MAPMVLWIEDLHLTTKGSKTEKNKNNKPWQPKLSFPWPLWQVTSGGAYPSGCFCYIHTQNYSACVVVLLKS